MNSDYDALLLNQLYRNRVFVDMQDFLETVLWVPAGMIDSGRNCYWRAVETIFKDKTVQMRLQAYLEECSSSRPEPDLYVLLMNLNNSILEIARTCFDAEPSDPLQFYRNEFVGSIFAVSGGPAHDIGAQLETLFQSTLKEDVNHRVPDFSFAWPMAWQVWEIKKTNNALFDGQGAPAAVLREGRNPRHTHRNVPPWNQLAAKRTAVVEMRSVSSLTTDTKKRKPAGGVATGRKKQRTSAPTRPSQGPSTDSEPLSMIDEDPDDTPPKRIVSPHLQTARYAAEQFLTPGFRSACTQVLVDGVRVQAQHYNHSAILVSAAIDLQFPVDFRKYIAMLIGSDRLTPRQRGFLGIIDQSSGFLTDPEHFRIQCIEDDPDRLYRGMTIRLKKTNGREFIITLGDVIAQEDGIVGRSTATVHATSSEWPDLWLVVKFSWPTELRTPEVELVNHAVDTADEEAGEGKRHWVLDHLPNMLHSQDFAPDEDSPERRVAKLLDRAVHKGNKFVYENRPLRITVQELLFPFDTLSTVADIAQVVLDVLQCHYWLYNTATILHRDISLSNIMYRYDKDGQICGVLNDFDLACLLAELQECSISPQCVGTTPFMAIDLLDPLCESTAACSRPSYRYDLESFCYVLFVICFRYTLDVDLPHHEAPTLNPTNTTGHQSPPSFEARLHKRVTSIGSVDEWFRHDKSWRTIASHKHSFFFGAWAPTLAYSSISPELQVLKPWLSTIWTMFSHGFVARSRHTLQLDMSMREPIKVSEKILQIRKKLFGDKYRPMDETRPSAPPPFDVETLGGYVTYHNFLAPAAGLITPLNIRFHSTY